jgi:hypothetical protein
MVAALTPTALSPREAVADALHRCVLGTDTNDQDLFGSACYLSLVQLPWKSGPRLAIFSRKPFTMITTHITSNIRIELKDGADTASMTTHAISYHVRPEDAFKPEDTSYTAGSLYSIDLVKDSKDGLWKFQKWDIKVLWTTGDIAVLHGQT